MFKIVLVVTLFHFYCGLRLDIDLADAFDMCTCSNPFPFLLWIATFKFIFYCFFVCSSSNPFPFLLWIATVTPFAFGGV